MKRLIISLLITISPVQIMAEERIELQGTSIIGNKELPKVLYIVPWKPAEKIDMTTPPYSSVLDDDLKPVDRVSFKRQADYYRELYPVQ